MAEKGLGKGGGRGGERREIYQREIKWEGSVVRNGKENKGRSVEWGACGE